LDDTVTCLVRGPASRYPSGFVWLFAAWFAVFSVAVLAVGLIASGRPSLWLGVSEITGLLIAACTGAFVLLTARRVAFRADYRGIVLGAWTSRKRPKLRQVYLPWSDVAQVLMVPRRYGVLVEIVLSPAALPVYRPSLGKQLALLLGVLVMPFGVGRGRPAITMPRANPPAYRVKVCEISAGELRLALAQLKPDRAPVRILNSRKALRLAAPRSRRAGPPRPAWPARQLGQSASKRPPTSAGRP
jgi:hypothetical protein